MTASIIAEASFLTGLHALGLLFAALWRRRLPAAFIWTGGMIWGAAAWVFLLLAGSVAGFVKSPPAMWTGIILIAAILALANLMFNPWRRRDFALFAISTSAFFLLIYILAHALPYMAMSYDSIKQLIIARRLGSPATPLAFEVFSDWGAFMVAAQAAAPIMLGQDTLPSFNVALFAVFMAQFLALGHHVAGLAAAKTWRPFAAPTLTLAAMISVPMVWFQFCYIHNNWIAAVYLFMFVSTFWLGCRERDWRWLVFASLALTSFAIIRTENPVVAVLLLAIGLSQSLPVSSRLLMTGPLSLTIIVWYSFLLLFLPADATILTVGNTLPQMILAGGLLVAAAIPRRPAIAFFWRLTPYLAFISLCAAVAAFVFQGKYQHMFESARSMQLNSFSCFYGLYGYCWVVAAALFLAICAAAKVPRAAVFTWGMAAYVLLVFNFGFLRPPYRVGWGDSSNRIMLHIVPCVFFFFLIAAFHGRGMGGHRALVVRLGRCAAWSALAGLILMAILKYPHDFADQGRILLANDMTWRDADNLIRPLDEYESVRSRIKRGYYALAAGPGARTVIVDLGGKVKAGQIQLEDVCLDDKNYDLRLKDFAVHVSEDMKKWTPVFDSASTSIDIRSYIPLADSRKAFDVEDIPPFRYVKLTSRKSGSYQGRFLLGEVSVRNPWSATARQKNEIFPITPRRSGNLSEGAVILAAPAAKPGHEFELALNANDKERTSVAAEPGPAELVIDFSHPASAANLSATFPCRGACPRDFEWLTSIDGKNWETVATVNSPATHDSETITWKMPPETKLRYLKFVFRGDFGGGPLRINHIDLR